MPEEIRSFASSDRRRTALALEAKPRSCARDPAGRPGSRDRITHHPEANTTLCQHRLGHMPGDIGEAVIATCVAEIEPVVIDPKQVQ